MMKTCCWVVLMAFAGVVWGQWTEPELIDSNEDTVGINTGRKEWCPFISADGQYLYFARERINNDLYVCHQTDSGWSDPQKLPFCIERVDERNPTVNTTNDTLYFIQYPWDIYWSFRTGPCDTCWGPPERMPEPINSSSIEFSVYCTPDNQRLLFSSTRSGGPGGEDLYECRRDATTPTGWSVPHLLSGPINTWMIESYPSMGLDSTEIFFWRSDRLYVSHLIQGNWTQGEPLPDYINRVIISFPSESTPCITPNGGRLYFSSRWSDSGAVAGDIWYSDRPNALPEKPAHFNRQGLQIEVFPNPSQGVFTLMLPGRQVPEQVAIYNLLGQRIWSRNSSIPVSSQTVNPDGLPNGSYFLQVSTREKAYTTRIIIIH